MATTTKQHVFDRLHDGKPIETIWREANAAGYYIGWNYACRLAREWKSEQVMLLVALEQAASDDTEEQGFGEAEGTHHG